MIQEELKIIEYFLVIVDYFKMSWEAQRCNGMAESEAEVPRDRTVDEYLKMVEEEVSSCRIHVENDHKLEEGGKLHKIPKEDQASHDIEMDEYVDFDKEDAMSHDITVEEYLKLVEEENSSRRISIGDHLQFAKDEISLDISKEGRISHDINLEEYLEKGEEENLLKDVPAEDYLKQEKGEISHDIAKEIQTSYDFNEEDRIDYGMPVEDYLRLAKLAGNPSEEESMSDDLERQENFEHTNIQRCIKCSTKLVVSAKAGNIAPYNNVSVKYFQSKPENWRKKLENNDRYLLSTERKCAADEYLRLIMFKDTDEKFAQDIISIEVRSNELEALPSMQATAILEVKDKAYEGSDEVQIEVISCLFLEELKMGEAQGKEFLPNTMFRSDSSQKQVAYKRCFQDENCEELINFDTLSNFEDSLSLELDLKGLKLREAVPYITEDNFLEEIIVRKEALNSEFEGPGTEMHGEFSVVTARIYQENEEEQIEVIPCIILENLKLEEIQDEEDAPNTTLKSNCVLEEASRDVLKTCFENKCKEFLRSDPDFENPLNLEHNVDDLKLQEPTPYVIEHNFKEETFAVLEVPVEALEIEKPSTASEVTAEKRQEHDAEQIEVIPCIFLEELKLEEMLLEDGSSKVALDQGSELEQASCHVSKRCFADEKCEEFIKVDPQNENPLSLELDLQQFKLQEPTPYITEGNFQEENSIVIDAPAEVLGKEEPRAKSEAIDVPHQEDDGVQIEVPCIILEELKLQDVQSEADFPNETLESDSAPRQASIDALKKNVEDEKCEQKVIKDDTPFDFENPSSLELDLKDLNLRHVTPYITEDNCQEEIIVEASTEAFGKVVTSQVTVTLQESEQARLEVVPCFFLEELNMEEAQYEAGSPNTTFKRDSELKESSCHSPKRCFEDENCEELIKFDTPTDFEDSLSVELDLEEVKFLEDALYKTEDNFQEQIFTKEIDAIPQKPCQSLDVQPIVVGELSLETLQSVESPDNGEKLAHDLVHGNLITEDTQERIVVEEKKLQEKEKVDLPVPSQGICWPNNDCWPNNVLNLADSNNDGFQNEKEANDLPDISKIGNCFSPQCRSDILPYTMNGYATSHHTQMLVFKTGPKRLKPSCTSLAYCPVVGKN